MKVSDEYFNLMGIKHLGARRLLTVLMLLWFFILMVMGIFNSAFTVYYIWSWFLFIIVNIVIFAVAVRLTIEIYNRIIVTTFKWIREGFKKGYDV